MTIVVGLMSGTSLDGISAAVVRFTRAGEGGRIGYELLGYDVVAYDEAQRARLARALREGTPEEYCRLNFDLGELLARAAVQVIAESGVARREVAAIASHGQTLWHVPGHSTWQVGEASVIAERLGRPVVSDFRVRDMAAGGQGAPLVPIADALLFGGAHWRALQNIGGIGNVTVVPPNGGVTGVRAFDTGPGNALIDQWVSREGGIPFDADGAIASEGDVVRGVVDRYLEKPFFGKPGPKSLDRNDFTLAEAEGMELADGARTLAAVSAQAILKSVEHLPGKPKLWIVCGGGRKNPHIVRDLREGAEAAGAQAVLAEDIGLDGDATEAEAWAYLAVRVFKGLPLTFPTTTGCRQPVSGGVLVRPLS